MRTNRKFRLACIGNIPIKAMYSSNAQGEITVEFISLLAIATLSLNMNQASLEAKTRSKDNSGKSGTSDCQKRSHGLIGVLEWATYFPERSGSTVGWPSTWKRRPPLSAYFLDCVSGPCLAPTGPCHGDSCVKTSGSKK